MKFYTKTHKYYCEIDLHTKDRYVCIIDYDGEVLVHKNIKASADALNQTSVNLEEPLD